MLTVTAAFCAPAAPHAMAHAKTRVLLQLLRILLSFHCVLHDACCTIYVAAREGVHDVGIRVNHANGMGKAERIAASGARFSRIRAKGCRSLDRPYFSSAAVKVESDPTFCGQAER